MGKEQKSNKEGKKEPSKTAKEKKQLNKKKKQLDNDSMKAEHYIQVSRLFLCSFKESWVRYVFT